MPIISFKFHDLIGIENREGTDINNVGNIIDWCVPSVDVDEPSRTRLVAIEFEAELRIAMVTNIILLPPTSILNATYIK